MIKLKDHADVVVAESIASGSRGIVDSIAAVEHFAFVGNGRAAQGLDQGRFSGTVVTNDRQNFVRL